jgi:tripartite ATP-independent transporter DctM subunit
MASHTEGDTKMTFTELAILGILLVLVLMFLKMPVGLAMALGGFIGLCLIRGVPASLSNIAVVALRQGTFYMMTVIPLFIFMGIVASYGGLSARAFSTINKWMGHLPGGLAMAVAGACAAFGAVCGDNIATAGTLLQVALPEMRKNGYKDELSLGCIACSGNLGFLIPPSAAFIIYGIVTQESIGKLFLAGILPGILVMLLFWITIYIWVKTEPSIAPMGPKATWPERIRSIGGMWEILIVFLVVMGGIYTGIFTPTEGAACGAAIVLIVCLARRKLSWKHFQASLSETGQLTALIFLMIMGAMIFSTFLTTTEVGFRMAEWIQSSQIHPMVVLAAILILYLILGCIMDIFAAILVTLPIFYPLMMALGFDSIWFGVQIVMMVCIGGITPPVGILVFAVKGMAPDVPLYTIFRGTVPFVLAMIVAVIILIAFPDISTIIPRLMTGPRQ